MSCSNQGNHVIPRHMRIEPRGSAGNVPRPAVVQWGMAAITPEEALAYFRRWELVREAEARELRRTPMETKLQQLASLMASRHVFGPEPDREAQLQLVRERWARLRRVLSG